MTARWYPMAGLPFGRVHVRVFWNARQFPAVRALHPKTRKLTWCEYRNGEIRWLPPATRRGESEWSAEPERWQPLDPSVWKLPLPEPLPIQVVPRLSYTKTRFDAMSAADMAREMEEAREAARANPDRELDQETTHERIWWRDVTNIKYENRGQVTRLMAEGRVMRAMSWCGVGRDLTLKARTTGTVMAELADKVAAALAEAEERWQGVPRFQPLPQDHDDFEVAMGWVSALSPPETWHKRRRPWSLSRMQRVLLLRALTVPLSWADIAHEFHISPARARQIYGKAVDSCWRVANGGRAHEDIPIVDQVQALQERNRAYRRRG